MKKNELINEQFVLTGNSKIIKMSFFSGYCFVIVKENVEVSLEKKTI